MRTLEDLRKYLLDKYSKIKSDNLIVDYNRLLEFVNEYDLSEDEISYIMPIGIALEEQTNKATLISAKKAQEILLRKKNRC